MRNCDEVDSEEDTELWVNVVAKGLRAGKRGGGQALATRSCMCTKFNWLDNEVAEGLRIPVSEFVDLVAAHGKNVVD